MRGVPPHRRLPVGAERHRTGAERLAAEPDAVVDRRDGAGDGVELGPRPAERERTTGELRGEGRPGGIEVTSGELATPKARTGTGLDERADLGAVVVEHDREVGHVGTKPRELHCGRHDPRRHEHRQRDVRRGDVRRVDVGRGDDVVAERSERGRDTDGDGRVADGVDGDDVTPGRLGSRLVAAGQQGGLEERQQLVDVPVGTAQAGADGMQRRPARAVPERREQAALNLTGVGHHRPRADAADLQLSRRSPDEGQVRVDARAHAESMPEVLSRLRHPSTAGGDG
jgi:hypothetical protein